MGEQSFELEVVGDLESLPVILDFVADTMKRLGIEPSVGSRVQLAIDEACTNIIKHAYSQDKDTIALSLQLAGEELIVTIVDKGRPFDPTSVPAPDLDADLEDRRIGGLGIHFMKSLMDQVVYAFDPKAGNRLTMRKHLSPADAQPQGFQP